MQPIKIADMRLFEHDSEEKIIGEARRHPIGLVVISMVGTLIIISLGVSLYLLSRNQESVNESVSGITSYDVVSMLGYILMALIVLVFIGVILAINIYRHSYIVLTNQKIVLVHSFSLIRRSVSQLSIGDVQDVAVSQATVLSRIFSYGMITIETAGEQSNVWMSLVSKPFDRSAAIVAAHEVDVQIHGN